MLVPRRVNGGKYTIVTWIRHGIVRLKLLTVSHFLTHFEKNEFFMFQKWHQKVYSVRRLV